MKRLQSAVRLVVVSRCYLLWCLVRTAEQFKAMQVRDVFDVRDQGVDIDGIRVVFPFIYLAK